MDLIGAKQIASVVGMIISMSLALDPVAHLITRSLYSVLNSRDSRLSLTDEARDEVKFWLARVSELMDKTYGQNLQPFA